MKKLIAIVAIATVTLAGCGKIDSAVNGIKSATGMLERTVTLYNANGQVIKSWVTDNQIEYAGPVAGFIAKDGTNVRVSGTFIIEGK
jgi:predicted small secreted protein